MTGSRIIIGISGASGSILGIRALRMAQTIGLETHFVISRAGEMTLGYETETRSKEVGALANFHYANTDVGAPIASGSFQTLGMLIAPCSIKTMSEIAYGMTGDLLTRAADVVLKERRKLVMMVRETPLHTGHLRAMTQASEIGAVIMPPTPAWYAEPKTIEDVETQLVARALEQFGVTPPDLKRWGEDLEKGRRRSGRGEQES